MRRSILLLLLAVAALALPVAGAAEDGSPVDASIADGSAQRRLDAARATWRAFDGASHYRMSVALSCNCTLPVRKPQSIEVRDGRPTRRPPASRRLYATVWRLLARVQEAIDQRVGVLTVRYDGRGVPRDLSVHVEPGDPRRDARGPGHALRARSTDAPRRHRRGADLAARARRTRGDAVAAGRVGDLLLDAERAARGVRRRVASDDERAVAADADGPRDAVAVLVDLELDLRRPSSGLTFSFAVALPLQVPATRVAFEPRASPPWSSPGGSSAPCLARAAPGATAIAASASVSAAVRAFRSMVSFRPCLATMFSRQRSSRFTGDR